MSVDNNNDDDLNTEKIVIKKDNQVEFENEML